MSNIIHIVGPSGSGKSTLYDRLYKKYGKNENVVLIDTDKIDDHHALKLLKNKEMRMSLINCEGSIFKAKHKMNKEWFNNIVSKSQSKIIIVVGLTFDQRWINADKKLCIKIDTEILWKRGQLRTITSCNDNFDAISKLMKSNIHPEVIKYLCVHKFKIRQDIIQPFCSFKEDINNFYNKYRLSGYSIKKADDIYDTIANIIQSIK